MPATPPPAASGAVPVLLLKTRSTPVDAYDELFSKPHPIASFAPRFVPVLEHAPNRDGLDRLRALLDGDEIGQEDDGATYGGLIITSQRAAEALAVTLGTGKGYPRLGGVPTYSVGPATSRLLRAVTSPSLQLFGEHTGNGEALAQFILGHYPSWCPGRRPNRPLLFLVGEQRRDVIPRMLSDAALAPAHRTGVAELVVYGTTTMPSFASDLAKALAETVGEPGGSRWVVVFSPAGAGVILTELEKERQQQQQPQQTRTQIATIGPTTRDYLKRELGLEPDVYAGKPSPEGLMAAMVEFMREA